MRKNKGLNPAHYEVKTILGDMLEPMYTSLLPLMDDLNNLRKNEMDLWFRRARTTDVEGANDIALQLKDTVARIQVMEAEMERKRTCIRAFLMLVGEKVHKVRREGSEPNYKPDLSYTESKVLGALTDLEPGRYEIA